MYPSWQFLDLLKLSEWIGYHEFRAYKSSDVINLIRSWPAKYKSLFGCPLFLRISYVAEMRYAIALQTIHTVAWPRDYFLHELGCAAASRPLEIVLTDLTDTRWLITVAIITNTISWFLFDNATDGAFFRCFESNWYGSMARLHKNTAHRAP